MVEAADTKGDTKDKKAPDKAVVTPALKTDSSAKTDRTAKTDAGVHADRSHESDTGDTAHSLINMVNSEVGREEAARIALADALRTQAAAARLLGSMDVTTESGAHQTLDPQGRVTKQETARAALELKYNDDGKQPKVTLKDKDGEWTSQDGKTFTLDGKVKTLVKNQDGTLDFKDAAGSNGNGAKKLDGPVDANAPAATTKPTAEITPANKSLTAAEVPAVAQTSAVLPDASQKRDVAVPAEAQTKDGTTRTAAAPVVVSDTHIAPMVAAATPRVADDTGSGAGAGAQNDAPPEGVAPAEAKVAAPTADQTAVTLAAIADKHRRRRTSATG